jgi:uncharacterized protein
MTIQEMTRKMNMDLLKRTQVGYIACAQGNQPYGIPFSFAYHDGFIYSFGTLGKKIEWMRANPPVCVEAGKIVSREERQTVVVFGRYQELHKMPKFDEARVVAHDLLAKTAMWWEPGYARTLLRGVERPLQPIYFRILMEETRGYQSIVDEPFVRYGSDRVQ